MIQLRRGLLILSALCGVLGWTGCGQSPVTAVHRADSLKLGGAYLTRCRTLEGVPTPSEAAARLKRLDPVFRGRLVISYNRIDYLRTSPMQALGIGAYAADLAYANLYDHPLEATRSLQAMQVLAEQLQVSDALNYRRLSDDLARGLTSDSLLSRLNLALSSFNSRLQSRGQLELSVMAVSGGWVEGMFLLTQHGGKSPHKSLCSMAAQQKPALDLILSIWESDSLASPVADSLFTLLNQTAAVLGKAQLPAQTAGMVPAGEWVDDADGIPTFRAAARPEPVLPPYAFDRLTVLVRRARQLIEQASARPTSNPTTT